MISVNQEIGASVPEKLIKKGGGAHNVSYKGARTLNVGVKHLRGGLEDTMIMNSIFHNTRQYNKHRSKVNPY